MTNSTQTTAEHVTPDAIGAFIEGDGARIRLVVSDGEPSSHHIHLTREQALTLIADLAWAVR